MLSFHKFQACAITPFALPSFGPWHAKDACTCLTWWLRHRLIGSCVSSCMTLCFRVPLVLFPSIRSVDQLPNCNSIYKADQ